MNSHKTYLITGGTSGVGKAIAKGIAQTGATVVIVSRNTSNGEKTVREISKETANPNVSFLTADLSLMHSVLELSETFKQKHNSLYGLVNAAGGWYFKKETTSEGLDQSFAVNYLSHFLLTNSLLDLMTKTKDSRIVTVGGNPRFLKKPKINLDDLQLSKSYGAIKSAGATMFDRIYFGFELADRLKGTSVSSMVFHPGHVKSNLGKNAPWWMKAMFGLFPAIRNAPDTCKSGVFVATKTNAAATNGFFFDDNNNNLDIRRNFDPSVGKKLWKVSERMLQKLIENKPIHL